MLIQEQSIRSLDLSELDLEEEVEEPPKEEEDEEESKIPNDDEDAADRENGRAIRRKILKEEENPYNRFLDIMEIF